MAETIVDLYLSVCVLPLKRGASCHRESPRFLCAVNATTSPTSAVQLLTNRYLNVVVLFLLPDHAHASDTAVLFLARLNSSQIESGERRKKKKTKVAASPFALKTSHRHYRRHRRRRPWVCSC